MLKRIFDVVVSAMALAVLLPVLIVVGIVIRLDSPGRALFAQERVGLRGRPFRLLKFRSMVETPESGVLITAADDSRITRVGRVLRRTKVDELPQLVNVLKGEMSMVGPRPEVPRYVALYPTAVRELVLSVRPGLTDEASIKFLDEGAILAEATDPETAYITEILPRKLSIYESYVRNQSFLGDIRILVKTVVRITAAQ